MSTATPSIRSQVFATVKRCTVIVGALAGLAIGYQAGVTEAGTGTPAVIPTVQAEPQEDDPGFDCRIHGNQICGPAGEFEAGCYIDGDLIIPWQEEMRGRGQAGCVDAMRQLAQVDPHDVTGTYEVPGGVLTVYADTTARYQPSA